MPERQENWLIILFLSLTAVGLTLAGSAPIGEIDGNRS
jgi:hypothetical protein